jgi:hypothetical protein
VNPTSTGLPSILGNENFAYGTAVDGHLSGIIGFQRESTGQLQTMQFNETDPTLDGYSANYTPSNPDGSPAGNYLVIQLYPYDSNPAQLGVYTVDSSGNISSTNTSSNMPTTSLFISDTTFSPDGTMFVASGDANNTGSGNGIEIYHFNGAAPLTLYKTLLTGTPIDQVAWDSSHHLYAMSYHGNKLYVFTVTSTSVTEDASISVPSPLGLVVVSKAASTGTGCTAPSSNGVNVCSPAEDATVTSPVQIDAAATVSGGVYRFELWNGGTKLASVDGGTMDQAITLAPGTYTLTFDAYNSTKSTHEYATRNITVK